MGVSEEKKVGKYLIYGLIDPRDGQLRYVGRSSSGLKRPQSTQRKALKGFEGNKTYKVFWLKELASVGLKPEIEVIEGHSSIAELGDSEIFWIAYFKSIGCRLTNTTVGGEGGLEGMKHTTETRHKMSATRGGLPEEKRAELVKLYLSGMSMRAVGRVFNIRSNVVYYVLRRLGVAIRNKSVAHPVFFPKDKKAECVVLYRQGWKCVDLAARYGVHKSSILKNLRASGVEIRGRWDKVAHG